MAHVVEPGGAAAASGPAGDPEAPYARLAVVGLIARGPGGTDTGCDAPRQGGREDQEWLLLRRIGAREVWDPPGGRVERGEDLFAATRREIAEETGLQVEVCGPCYAHLTYYKDERLVAISMACRASGDTDSVRLEPENAAAWRWIDVEGWTRLAAEGKTTWTPEDVARVTCLASTIWEIGDLGGVERRGQRRPGAPRVTGDEAPTCSELGLEPEDFLTIGLEAMQEVSDELGL